MELTGKCKVEFEKWYLETHYIKVCKSEDKILGDNVSNEIHLIRFSNKSPSMQYGVFIDFFDSVGEDVDSIYEHEYYLISNRYQNSDNHRLEARTAAIQKANEIYNK